MRAGRKLGTARTGGRQKGTPNKVTRQLKDTILGALCDAGGQAYLTRQAEENPLAFMALLGKVLPLQVNANAAVGGKLVIQWKEPTVMMGEAS